MRPPIFTTLIYKNIPLSIIYIALSLILTLNIFANHADHEYMRQVGTHYSMEMINTYDLSGDSVLPFVNRVLSSDARGGFSALWLGVIPWVMFGLLLAFRKKLTTSFEKLGAKLNARAEKDLPKHWIRTAKFVPCIVACAIILGVAGSGVAVVFKESAKEPGKIIFNPSRRQLKVARQSS